METRNDHALIRTLNSWRPSFLPRFLIAILFTPFLLTVLTIVEPQIDESAQAVAEPQEEVPSYAAAIQFPPKELVQIYAIVTANRPDISDKEAWRLTAVIHEECVKHKIDPILVLALIDVESSFRYAAVSPAGARGLMQILPYVGESLLQETGLDRHPRWNEFRPEFLDDPILNIKLGVYYLKDLKKMFRDRTLALTAYNLGPTETRNRLENDIAFSDRYARAVLARYQQYRRIHSPLF